MEGAELPPQEPTPPLILSSSFPELIDNTARSNWRKCPQYFFRASVQELRLRGSNIHLNAGGAFAKGLEIARRSFYEDNMTQAAAEASGQLALIQAYGPERDDMPPARSGDKSLANVLRAYESYMLEYPLGQDELQPLRFPNGRCGVEFTFGIAIPGTQHPETGNPIIYGGRFDMLAQRKGHVFVVDEKTASALGDQWRNNWTLDSQFTGYCWAARSYGHPVVGAVIRGVGLLKTKITHAEVQTFRPQWQIDRWLEQLQYEIEDMIRAWKSNRFNWALDKSACNAFGGCPYLTLCESPQPDQWLQSYYEVVHWNPLEPH